MKKSFSFYAIAVIFLAVVVIFCLAVGWGYIHAEEADESRVIFTVTGSNLNTRMSANKSSYAMTELDKGQEIAGTGRWSKDKKWVEIDHPECGRLWCSYQFLTERTEPFLVETLWDEPIKIRKAPFNGKVKGYLKKGQTLEITQVVLGWGKCSKGWIDLEYCIEIEE